MEENKLYVEDPRTEINIQKGSLKWKVIILENFRKKNNQIWSLYDREIPIINLKFGLKREIWNIHVFFTISWRLSTVAKKTLSFLAANQYGQGKTLFSWRLGQTAKERHRFLCCWDKQPRKHTFSLAANKNNQENILFWLFVVIAKEMLYSLAAKLWPPRKIEAAKVNLDWCSGAAPSPSALHPLLVPPVGVCDGRDAPAGPSAWHGRTTEDAATDAHP